MNTDKVKQSYETLGLSADAAPGEIRRAYRDLVRIWHPDRYVSDPGLQKKAQEKLKEINEAYAVVRRDLATGTRPHDPPVEATSSSGGDAVVDPEPSPARGKAKDRVSATIPRQRSEKLPPLFPFFQSWQNILFLILVASALHHASARFGTMTAGAVYVMAVLILPTTLAVACNATRLAAVRFMWGTYVAVMSICGIYLLADAVKFGNDLNEAAHYRAYQTPEAASGVKVYGGSVSELSPEPFSVPYGRAPDGPNPPAMPKVHAPEAPLAPAAPLVPTVPVAPAAR